MKIINRACLRIPPFRSQATVSDSRINSGVEVHLCPFSGDAEVWEGGNCRFKAYIENHSGKALVGLSYFVDQPKERPGWADLAAHCDRLPYEEASRLLSEYAVAVGLVIEDDIMAKRCTRRQKKEERTERKRTQHRKKIDAARTTNRS